MSVRPAGVEDAEGVARVQGETWQAAYRGILSDEFLDAIDWRTRVNHWRRIIADGSVFVAVVEDSVVGFIAVGPAHDEDVQGFCQLYAIYVTPSSWGSGVADELVEAALDSRPTVLWVFAENPRARRFYERHGFVTDGASQVETIGGREATEVRYLRR